MFAPKFKARAPPGTGIWTPKNQTPATSLNDLEKLGRPIPTPPPPPLPAHPIWTPQPSPTAGRKEFRPVRFESPTLPRRYILQDYNNNNDSAQDNNIQPPWSNSSAACQQRSAASCTNLSTPTTVASGSTSNYCDSAVDSPNSYMPSASVSDKIKTFERSVSASELDRPFVRRLPDKTPAVYKPNEVIFNVKHEYMSEPETENDRPRKMAQLGRRQYDGIGPVTNDGMPIILRSEVKAPHQHEWYKRLYQTIHKQKNGDDYVIRYKCQKGRLPYKSNGYQSEPEPPNYDSDYSTYKYRTINPRRLQSVSSATNVRTGANFYPDTKLYGTMPNPVKPGQNLYKNQPGRIEDYTTGHSSVSEKERKEWWDEVMDIFNGWQRAHTILPRIFIEFEDDIYEYHLDQAKLSPQYTEGNLSRALAKESGYSSDSNLVFRKKELHTSSALSPVEQKQAYKSLQAGGEPPLFGFRKPAPEKLKDCVEQFEYIQISPTLTKIRVCLRNAESTSECATGACNSTATQPTDPTLVFNHIPKIMPSFIPLSQQQKKEMPSSASTVPQPPPIPPNRKPSSAKASTKLKETQPNNKSLPPSITKRHEQCFQSAISKLQTANLPANKYGTVTLRKTRDSPLSRSKSAGAVANLLASFKQSCMDKNKSKHSDNVTVTRSVRLRSISPIRRQPRIMSLRQSSRSPVAFGRSISKERTFAEEKKRLENTLPPSRTNFEASTNILRDPSLKSPQDVKQAIRSYATCTAHARSKSLPRYRKHTFYDPTVMLSTTTRHSMCFPQTRPMPQIDYTKRVHSVAACNRARFAKSQERSPTRKLTTKAVSNDSLARTNSTFSIDSNKEQQPSKTKPCKKLAKQQQKSSKLTKAKGLQTSKSESQITASQSSSRKPSKATPIKAAPAKPQKSQKTQTTNTHYFQQPGNAPIIDEYYMSESVRDKTNFWNDFNTQQYKSLPAPKKYQSTRGVTTSREEHSTTDYCNYAQATSQEFSEAHSIDDLVWQYEQQSSKLDKGAHASTDVVPPQLPVQMPHQQNQQPPVGRRFSPTREVRVPAEQLIWQTGTSDYKQRGRNIACIEESRRFSPTREIRMPAEQLVWQTSHIDTAVDRHGEHVPRRRFSPTREVRVPPEPPAWQNNDDYSSFENKMAPQSCNRRFSPTREVRVPPEQLLWQNNDGDLSIEQHVDHKPAKRRFSPTREVRVPQDTNTQEAARNVRSPSRRRIESCRSQVKGEISKVVRASSLSSADDRSKRGFYLCGELAHSATSLDYYERHSPTCRYRNNSARFTDLNRFYSTLERVGQLERATSITSFKPIRKDTELLDFDEWRKVRQHERAEKELQYLVNKLKQEQREKDLLFRSKDVEDVKWRQENDFGLHAKEKSVEDLREDFETKLQMRNPESHDATRRDIVRPFWRRNTVADLTTSLEVRMQDTHDSTTEKPASGNADLQLSNRLVSTLTKEQVSKITQQLNEIYASQRPDDVGVSEEYVMTVEPGSKPTPTANALKVRCNSTMTKDDLIDTKMRKQAVHQQPPNKNTKSATRSTSPIMVGREMLGAIAAKNADLNYSKPPQIPPYPKKPLEPVTDQQTKKLTKEKASEDTTQDKITQKIQFFEERQFEEPPKTIYHAREDSSPDEAEVMRLIEENMKIRKKEGFRRHKELSTSLTEIRDVFGKRQTTTSTATRVNFQIGEPNTRPPDPHYAQHEPDDSHDGQTYEYYYDDLSPPNSIELYDAYYRSRSISPQSQTSSSYLQRVATGEVQKMKQRFESINNFEHNPNERNHFFGVSSLRKVRSDTELQQYDSVSKDTLHTNNSTVAQEEPEEEEEREEQHTEHDVSWLTHKFEASNSLQRGNETTRGRARKRKVISPTSPRSRLMPHIDIISKTAALKQDIRKTSPQTRPISPVRSNSSNSGIVERIRSHFEYGIAPMGRYISTSNPDLRDVHAIPPHLSANWIAHKYPHPGQNTMRANAQANADANEKCNEPPKLKPKRVQRPRSTSPTRPPKSIRHQQCGELTAALKPYYDDIFANQPYDPKKHQPKARYVPVGAEAMHDTNNNDKGKINTTTISGRPSNGNYEFIKKSMAVTFQEFEYAPPIPPQPPVKGYVPYDMNGNYRAESPNRYYESDVNIHFKTPVRHEFKQALSEEELAKRQAEQMQKLYQEERRRKYLQELQDMNARRHTDNFTPSQKSPIPLNRYDDFPADLAPKSPSNYLTKTAARALYSFQGQSARELSFKKGDVIYLRRQIDKNWYEGEFNAMIGLLPVNYVEIISREGIQTKQPKKPSEGQARAKYNFQAQSGVELSLNKGELVTLTRRVDDNWFEGKIANRKGIFPVSYVEVLTDIGAEDIAAKTTIITNYSTTDLRPSLDILRTNINNEFNTLTQNGNQPANGILKETKKLQKTDMLHVDTSSEPLAYRALYKYRPQNSDELELLEGDIVHVLEKCDDGWFVGTSQRSGCFGTFPGNYVERV